MKTGNLLLGTITFGQQTDIEQAREMVNTALDAGVREIDSAYVYNEGTCEMILGEILKDIPRDRFRIATKVNPRITGKLDREAVTMQQKESLRRLNLDYSDVMYLHFPDPTTPIEETLDACNDLYKQGLFRELGLSNYHIDDIVKISEICKAEYEMKPVVFEGVYNAFSRNVENDLLPGIRRLGMRFTAYNPLAGGMLTGKYMSFEEKPDDGRFAVRASYQKRYWKEEFFEGADIIRKACDEEGIAMAEASLRWLEFHSGLSADHEDGIIIGASRPSQLAANLKSIEQGPLPESMLDAFDRAWEACRSVAPSYFRTVGK
ncbi:MAG: aldo/keto reductase [Eubacterium sp.]|nr:aldo/keto reductase [Eubacterium sp.]